MLGGSGMERMVGTMTGTVIQALQTAGRTLGGLALCGMMMAAWGQASAVAPQEAKTNSPAFEVASVRLAKPDCSFMTTGMSHGRYRGICMTAWGLIYNAYEVPSLWDHPPGLPAWADTDRFDVEAKADEETTAAMEKLSTKEQEHLESLLLQSLLAERFQLRVHYESRSQPVYELVLAKSGPRIKPLPANQKPGWGMKFMPGEFIVSGKSISEFAHALSISNLAGRTVVDKTGLAGNYDFDLKWARDNLQDPSDAGPSLFTALEEQLGLKLVPAKGPVQTLVVDHVERPTPN